MVVKEGCQSIEIMSTMLGDNFEQLADFFIDTLFKVIAISNHVISDCGIQVGGFM